MTTSVIKFRTADKHVFPVDRTIAYVSALVRKTLDEDDDDDVEKIIPLPMLLGETFALTLKFMKAQFEEPLDEKKHVVKPIRSKELEDNISHGEFAMLMSIEFTPTVCRHQLVAAEFLEMPFLTTLCALYEAVLIRNKTPSTIAKEMGIVVPSGQSMRDVLEKMSLKIPSTTTRSLLDTARDTGDVVDDVDDDGEDGNGDVVDDVVINGDDDDD